MRNDDTTTVRHTAQTIKMSLQELVAEQLGALSLRDDPDTVEFVVGLVEEESFESEVSIAGFL